MCTGLKPLIDSHGGGTTRCDVDHRVTVLLNNLQKWLKCFRTLVGLACQWIASMQMHQRRSGGMRTKGCLRDLGRRNRQIRRHRWRMDRARHGASHHDLATTLQHSRSGGT